LPCEGTAWHVKLSWEPSLFPWHQSQGEGVTALHTRRMGMIAKNQLEKNHSLSGTFGGTICQLEGRNCSPQRQLSKECSRQTSAIPSPHDSEEEDARVENEYGNPFAERGVHRHQPLVQAQANRWESGFKLENSTGVSNPRNFWTFRGRAAARLQKSTDGRNC
jgi:hypothetical protein